MGLTTDPNHPQLLRGGMDKAPVDQAPVYLVLTEEERAKGFIKPYRNSYIHVGPTGPKYPLRDLTPEELERYGSFGYVKYEEYLERSGSALGRFWTQEDLDAVGKCGNPTCMTADIAETYARDPWFYGLTYCAHCRMHRPLSEFRWIPDGESMDPNDWPTEEHERIAALRSKEDQATET